MSSVSMCPEPFSSRVNVNSLPCVSCLPASYSGDSFSNKVNCRLPALFAYDVDTSFLSPKRVKLAVKYRVKLLHSGSSHGHSTVLSRNTSGSAKR